MLTNQLFAAYLECPTKCFLLASGEQPTGNTYAHWFEQQNMSYRSAGVKRLVDEIPQKDVVAAPPLVSLKKGAWRIAIDVAVRAQNLESSLYAAERIPDNSTIIPIRFIFTNKLSRNDKLLLAFDAFVLSKNIGITVEVGKIIHGDDYTATKVKMADLLREVKKKIGKISTLLSGETPPKLLLNRHCSECVFQERCHKIAEEKDDLSLLNGLPEKERTKLNNKGIFSVTQLSYTFRPRRRSKQHAARPEKHHHSLKALAIREQKIHIVGSPHLKIEGTPVFFDVEGLPDRDFYYLIGVRLQTAEGIVQHSLWADSKNEEQKIWSDFLTILSAIEAPILLHYGSFETTFLKRMCERYGEPPENSVAAKALKSSVNLLSIIFAQIYFPTYSNGLKEIAKYLGFNWDDPSSSGLQSLVWRYQWEQSCDPMWQEKLITYNADDCEALSLVADAVCRYTAKDTGPNQTASAELGVVHTDSLGKVLDTKWKKFKSPVGGLEQINNAAYWDYQRDRVYARTGIIKRQPKQEAKPRRVVSPVDMVVVWNVPHQCPKCEQKRRKKGQLISRIVQDIVFGKSSLKRRVIKYVFQTYRCHHCGYVYGLDDRYWQHTHKYGWNLLAYFVFNIVELAIPQLTFYHGVNRLFGIDLSRSTMNNLKIRAAAYYSSTKENILRHILKGNLIHADETRANIRGKLAYVWVLTNLHEVVYIITESREGEFIQNLLANFKGVLVSDFYTAYDSIECPQQKCLIHLMRDLNDEVLKNPFDEDLKKIVTGFAGILQPMVATIDKHGLKKYFLRKHIKAVERFYKMLDRTPCKSEVAIKCKQRFEKNRDTLFTFLRYDGVPWNNNNAEHAIKSFARLRDVISGSSTKKGIEEYLILLSICRTCEYQQLDFLDFLRSGEHDIAAYAKRKRPARKKRGMLLKTK